MVVESISMCLIENMLVKLFVFISKWLSRSNVCINLSVIITSVKFRYSK